MRGKQTHTGEAAASWVEVWFKIEKDADGYPESKSWEGLWAEQRNGVYALKSVPFYLKNVSVGDEVEAAEGEFLEFQKVVARAGHNTYRLLLSESHRSKLREIVMELEELGLTVETEIGMLLAIDVPPSLDQEYVDAFLTKGKEHGRWEVQDGCLNGFNNFDA
jgi:hypothetical protein